MGYRGTLSIDAIITPEQDLLFTEYNGRITGSTHIYEVLGKRLIGPDHARTRVLMDRIWPSEWSTSSFDDALERITSAGLAYDPVTRTGTVLCSAFDRHEKSVMHCVIAPTLDEAWEQQARLQEVFGHASV
jgi:hypothetical protein